MNLGTTAVFLICSLSALPALAQTDFSNLRIATGDAIRVTDEQGNQVTGPLTSLGPMALAIKGYEFKPVPGLKIERLGDPIWDGFLKGFLVGALVTTFTFQRAVCEGSDRSLLPCVAGFGALYGAVGAIIDRKHQGGTLVYQWSAAQVDPRITVVIGGRSTEVRAVLFLR